MADIFAPDEVMDDGPAAPPPDDTMISIRNLHKGFGGIPIIKGLDIEVPRQTNSVVLGGSGTGKSVLIKHVVGLLKPDRGQVWADGKRIDHLSGEALDRARLSMGYLFQGGALFDSMTVFENMDFLLQRHSDMSRAERAERINETLDWVNLRQTSGQYPAELSGGQQKRIGLARSIILEPKIMLYDEPTTGLDPVSVRVVSDLIVRLRDERGITSVSITHDLLCAEIIADDVHFLYKGEIVESGSLEDLRTSNHPALREFFGLERKW